MGKKDNKLKQETSLLQDMIKGMAASKRSMAPKIDEDRELLRRSGLNEEGIEAALKLSRESFLSVHDILNCITAFGFDTKYLEKRP